MRAATRDLRTQILEGRVSATNLTDQQLKAIKQGKAEIPGFTWHHHQDRGKMQLIPYEVHKDTGHVGGMNVWYFEK